MSFKEMKKYIYRGKKVEKMIPVSLEYPSDSITPVLAFTRLRALGQKTFFLESVEGGENLGRYCFMGVNPFESIKVRENKVTISGEHNETIETKDPIKCIKVHLKKYEALKDHTLPPFCGGAIGHISYDSIQYIEELKSNQKDSYKIDENIHLALYKDVIAFDRVKDKVIIISNFYAPKKLNQTKLKSEYNNAQANIRDLAKIIFTPGKNESKIPNSISEKKLPPLKVKPLMGREKFKEKIKIIKRHINKGDIFQCVLSEQFEVKIDIDPFYIYRSLRSTTPAPYLYYLSMDDYTLLGASPEMLVRVKNGNLQTCPIAGTRPRGKTEKEDKQFERDLLASVKEKAEHLMLVDLGRNDLGRVAKPGSVAVTDFMQVHRYSNVMHLVSLVEAKLKKGKDPWDALQGCFPAGTLSGAPKIKAMEIIYELEEHSRGPYGGAIIYFDFGGDLDSCITIRSLTVKNGKGIIQAGAGIVVDSRADAEYDEVCHKSLAIKTAIEKAIN